MRETIEKNLTMIYNKFIMGRKWEIFQNHHFEYLYGGNNMDLLKRSESLVKAKKSPRTGVPVTTTFSGWR